ncbi:MAG: hypothetical protein ACFFG0_49260 [Candidatus Thorarchaeota archaeon]
MEEEYQKNDDGSFKLDEQGNKIPIEVVEKSELEVANENIANLVEEIKQVRLEKGIAEGLLKEYKESKENKPEVKDKPESELTEEEKLNLLVDKRLKEREASSAQANKKAAFEKFVTENKEFDPENDPTGLKMGALRKKFDQFNTDNLTTIDEFLSVIKESKILLLGNDKKVEISRDDKNPYSNPPKINNNPDGKKPDELSPKELKLATQTGKTKEQILKLKQKNPEYLASLLEYIHD